MPLTNVDAERAIVGAILADPEVIQDVIDVVDPTEFCDASAKAAYKAISDLYMGGDTVDPVTVAAKCGHPEALDYLYSLADYAVAADKAVAYAGIVRDLAERRRIVDIAIRTKARAEDLSTPVSDTVDTSAADIMSTRDNKSDRAMSIFDAVQQAETSAHSAVVAYRDGKPLPGVPSGIKDLDARTGGFKAGQLIILAARPGMGKTALALDIARNATLTQEKKVMFFSQEMSCEEIGHRMITALAGISSEDMTLGRLTDDDLSAISFARMQLTDAPLYVDDTPGASIAYIRARAKKAQLTTGIDLIVIDYLQLLELPGGGENRNLEIGALTRSLKKLAKELRIPIIALSQLSRECEKRPDKHPMLSDLRDSGAIEQDADLILFLYRKSYYAGDVVDPDAPDPAELIIAKGRHVCTGAFLIDFLPARTTFRDHL